jgi:hypothetical protein
MRYTLLAMIVLFLVPCDNNVDIGHPCYIDNLSDLNLRPSPVIIINNRFQGINVFYLFVINRKLPKDT